MRTIIQPLDDGRMFSFQFFSKGVEKEKLFCACVEELATEANPSADLVCLEEEDSLERLLVLLERRYQMSLEQIEDADDIYTGERH